MPPIFQRHNNVQCFFCNSTLPIPQNPFTFRCSFCGCWNRCNEQGHILSDEPAMHEEYLNQRSFAKRASPSKDQLPNADRPTPFCHNCQTNHMLVMNLLSNYLPPPESPEYQRRLEMLPEYRDSLHARYPPLCDLCRPIVEEEIQQKEQMARRKALGVWLKEGKDRRRRVSGTPPTKEKVVPKSIYWKIRGVLWALSSLISMVVTSAAALDCYPFKQLAYLNSVLPLLVFLSLLWTAWDPTYLSVQNAQIQGRVVRVKGKFSYIACQMIAWVSRLSLSTLFSLCQYNHNQDLLHIHDIVSGRRRIYFAAAAAIDFIAFFISPFSLRLQHPPAIRLIDTQSHRNMPSRSATPTIIPQSSISNMIEPDLLASLSLSSKPVMTSTNPVFGLPSLLSAPSTPTENQRDEDPMDWSPTNDDVLSLSKIGKQKQSEEDSTWLRPQRFFAPEKPTGLESLFERTNLDEDAMHVDKVREDTRHSSRMRCWTRWPIFAMLSLIFLLPLVYLIPKLWLGEQAIHQPQSMEL